MSGSIPIISDSKLDFGTLEAWRNSETKIKEKRICKHKKRKSRVHWREEESEREMESEGKGEREG